MEKELTKNEKGITLVALIITIIVLLILAVISIRAITGDNILGKSETAKEKYESAKSNELDILKNYENNIEPEKLDVQKVKNKAYVWESMEDTICVNYITNLDTGYIFKSLVYDKSGTKLSTEYDLEANAEISSEFKEKKIFINNEEVILSPQTAVMLKINGVEAYITEKYLITTPIEDGDNLKTDNSNMLFSERNENYDQYAK